ncbi:MAG: GH25 family lysozyme, partial [Chloroflexota bacterium]
MEAIGMITINDISQYQEFCDFKKFKTKSFGVILKAGQGAWLDKRFEEFRNSAIQEGVAFGTYWFYDERFSPKEQAQLWANTIKNNPGVLGAWLSL